MSELSTVELDRLELGCRRNQVAAVEALIAHDSGQAYTPIGGGMRMFREQQIREALAARPAEPPPADQARVGVTGAEATE